MKNIFIFIPLLFCVSCSWGFTTVNTGYGQSTKLPIKHAEAGDNYKIKTVVVSFGQIEFNISDHQYIIVDEEMFSCLSIGTKLHLKKSFSWFFVDLGAGFRLTETDERNKWLADSHLLGDMSFSTGIKREFSSFSMELFYTFQHLSVPWRDDQGLNYDMVQFGIIVPF